jgi:hypothetical protein
MDARPLYEYDYSYCKWILTNGQSSFTSIPTLYRSCSKSGGQGGTTSAPSVPVIALPALGCFNYDILREGNETKREMR